MVQGCLPIMVQGGFPIIFLGIFISCLEMGHPISWSKDVSLSWSKYVFLSCTKGVSLFLGVHDRGLGVHYPKQIIFQNNGLPIRIQGSLFIMVQGVSLSCSKWYFISSPRMLSISWSKNESLSCSMVQGCLPSMFYGPRMSPYHVLWSNDVSLACSMLESLSCSKMSHESCTIMF